MLRNSDFDISPAGKAVGAEVTGIDLGDQLPDNAVSRLRQALGDYGVLFFRNQSLTPQQHIAFADRFGPINVNRFFTTVPDYPMIAEVRKDPGHTRNIGGGWHTDHSYDQVPACGSILISRETPNVGGDTLFASMYAAYEALSDGLKQTLSNLRAWHSSRHTFGPEAMERRGDLNDRLLNAEQATQDAVHPVVIRHPISGKPALYVNPGFTLRFDGWTEEESRPLLQYLFTHSVRPEFTYRFAWQAGSVAFWDNRATWHYAANDYPGERRLMHRITVEGTPLAAYN